MVKKSNYTSIQHLAEDYPHQVEHQIAHLVEDEARSNKARKVAVLEVCNIFLFAQYGRAPLCQPVTMVAAVVICCCNSFTEKRERAREAAWEPSFTGSL